MALRGLVLGGSGALGRAVCEALSQRGCALAFSYFRNEPAARELASKLGARALQLDASGATPGAVGDTVRAAAEALGGLDALVHCVGASPPEPRRDDRFATMEELPEEAFDHAMNLHARSAWLALRAAAPLLRAAGGGNVVLVGSLDGHLSVPALVHHAASKGALEAMARAAAKELGRDGVRVNTLVPGLLAEGVGSATPASLQREFQKHGAMKRLGTTREVARVAAWLATENTYLTGQAVVVDGGL